MLSIVILAYKNPALIRLCLKSLFESISDNLDYEVIVVDNATSLETQNVVIHEFQNKFSNIKLIPLKENTGYTKGVNEGLKAAQGNYILYLNHDVVIPKGAIEKLLDFIKQNPKVGLASPELLNFNGTHQNSYFKFYSPFTVMYRRMPYMPGAKKELDKFEMKDSDYGKVIEPDWITGAVFITSRAALDKVGLMDENLYHYFSDVDWARRFWNNGYKVVYFPESKIFHYHGRASKGRLGILDFFYKKETRWHISDAVKYFKKNGILNSKCKMQISK